MYAAVDPIYMVMLIKLLGPGYEVWDKAASIRFRHPGRSTLRATFRIHEEELAVIRAATAQKGRTERQYTVDLVDEGSQVCFSCEKMLSIRRRRPHVDP